MINDLRCRARELDDPRNAALANALIDDINVKLECCTDATPSRCGMITTILIINALLWWLLVAARPPIGDITKRLD